MRFKLIIAGLLGLFGLYAAYWMVMANRLEAQLDQFALEEQAKGNEVHWETLSITGFPARMRVALGGVAYVQNVGSATMRFIMTDTLIADVMPYKLNHAIFDFPAKIIVDRHDPQDLNKRLQTGLAFDQAHMSVVLTDQGPRVGFEGTQAVIDDQITGRATADTLSFYMRPGAGARDLEVYVEIENGISPLFDDQPYGLKGKTLIEQGAVLFQGLNAQDWAEVGGRFENIDLLLTAQHYSIYAVGAATLSQDGIVQAKLDATVNQTDGLLAYIGAQEDWSDDNHNLIAGLVSMADIADGAADKKAKVQVVADDRAVMAGPFRISDPVNLSDLLGF